MSITAISSKISSTLSDDLMQVADGSMYPAVDPAKDKLGSDPTTAAQAQDSISISPKAYSEKEKATLDELKKVDQEVQMHEAAHQAAAGELFRGKSFTYKVGPDGQRYAVAGDVQIDTSPIPGNPKATVEKMEKIRRAALAPGDPSSQDMKVASEAMKAEVEARQELSRQTFSTEDSDSPKYEVHLPKIEDTSKEEGENKAKSSISISTTSKSSNYLSVQKSYSAGSGMHISTLFGSELASGNEGRYIDVSL